MLTTKKVISEHRGYKSDLQQSAKDAIEEMLKDVPDYINGKVSLILEVVKEPSEDGEL